MPCGIIKEILSANSPHLALFTWNMTTHVTIITVQIAAPTPEKITSIKVKK